MISLRWSRIGKQIFLVPAEWIPYVDIVYDIFIVVLCSCLACYTTVHCRFHTTRTVKPELKFRAPARNPAPGIYIFWLRLHPSNIAWAPAPQPCTQHWPHLLMAVSGGNAATGKPWLTNLTISWSAAQPCFRCAFACLDFNYRCNLKSDTKTNITPLESVSRGAPALPHLAAKLS